MFHNKTEQSYAWSEAQIWRLLMYLIRCAQGSLCFSVGMDSKIFEGKKFCRFFSLKTIKRKTREKRDILEKKTSSDESSLGSALLFQWLSVVECVYFCEISHAERLSRCWDGDKYTSWHFSFKTEKWPVQFHYVVFAFNTTPTPPFWAADGTEGSKWLN